MEKKCVLEASWKRFGPHEKSASLPPSKPGLAMEREARFYSYSVALYGYQPFFSALANCDNILAGGRSLAHVTDAVCSELRRFAARSRAGGRVRRKSFICKVVHRIPLIFIDIIWISLMSNRAQEKI